MVIRAGMIRPLSFAVFALKALQNSMILTPWGPKAVPTGGAGLAWPAGICILTIALIFFAMAFSLRADACPPRAFSGRPKPAADHLDFFFHLAEIELDGRVAAENADHHLQLAAFQVDLFHLAGERGEGPFHDFDQVALVEVDLAGRPLLGALHLAQHAVELVGLQGRRRVARADEAGHLGRVADRVPALVVQVHLDQYVAGVETLG